LGASRHLESAGTPARRRTITGASAIVGAIPKPVEKPAMALDRKLLDVLCCPISKQPVHPLNADQLQRVNEAIGAGQLRYLDDSPVAEPLAEGLVTDNGARVYRVDDGIPIMLEEKAIDTGDLRLK
jgi:uncharacterized protein YbaR (Trm112 family)